MKFHLLLLILLIALVACGASQASDPMATPEQRTPVGPPSTGAAPPADGVIYGRNDDGTFFHGAPDAPVTFIDYSDFL